MFENSPPNKRDMQQKHAQSLKIGPGKKNLEDHPFLSSDVFVQVQG